MFTGVIIFLLFIFFPGNSSVAGDAASVADDPVKIQCLIKAYPEFLMKSDHKFVYWKDGTKMRFDDDNHYKSFDSLLNYPSISDMFDFCYPAGENYQVPIKKNYDPGRIRYEPFFLKMYGKNKNQVLKNLTVINWYGRKLKVTKVNGVDKKLIAVLKDLKKLPRKFHKYFTRTAGTFNWRNIAGTNRKSVHSFGIAIDINTAYSNYWRWSKPGPDGNYKYISRIPIEIVKVFEKHGFIWGGKWYHYDTMHFEYRPELLQSGCSCK